MKHNLNYHIYIFEYDKKHDLFLLVLCIWIDTGVDCHDGNSLMHPEMKERQM